MLDAALGQGGNTHGARQARMPTPTTELGHGRLD
jgi:hypothetical protein